MLPLGYFQAKTVQADMVQMDTVLGDAIVEKFSFHPWAKHKKFKTVSQVYLIIKHKILFMSEVFLGCKTRV